jgi:hypothetical protein
VVWCGVVWCGVVWCGVVWCGVVWCGVVWCGVVWCGVGRGAWGASAARVAHAGLRSPGGRRPPPQQLTAGSCCAAPAPHRTGGTILGTSVEQRPQKQRRRHTPQHYQRSPGGSGASSEADAPGAGSSGSGVATTDDEDAGSPAASSSSSSSSRVSAAASASPGSSVSGYSRSGSPIFDSYEDKLEAILDKCAVCACVRACVCVCVLSAVVLARVAKLRCACGASVLHAWCAAAHVRVCLQPCVCACAPLCARGRAQAGVLARQYAARHRGPRRQPAGITAGRGLPQVCVCVCVRVCVARLQNQAQVGVLARPRSCCSCAAHAQNACVRLAAVAVRPLPPKHRREIPCCIVGVSVCARARVCVCVCVCVCVACRRGAVSCAVTTGAVVCGQVLRALQEPSKLPQRDVGARASTHARVCAGAQVHRQRCAAGGPHVWV